MADKMQENNAIFVAKNAIVDGSDLWMLSNDTDVLLHFDFTSLQLLDYHIFPGKELMQYAHLGLAKSGDIIYAAPHAGSMLVFFDCVSGEMGNINIPYATDESRKKNKFNIIVAWKSCLLLIGHAVKGIFYYDTASGTYTKDMNYLEELKKVGCDIATVLFSDCYCQRNNKLYVPVFCKDIILEIDIEKKINRIHRLTYGEEIRLRTIDGYVEDEKEKFLLTTVNGEMLIWSPIDGVEKMKIVGGLGGKKRMYMRAFHIGGKNYFIAVDERKVFVEKDDMLQELKFEYENRGSVTEGAGGTQFEAIFRNKTDIYFQARSNGQLFRIDTSEDIVYRMDFDVASSKRKEIADQVCSSRPMADMLIENAWFGLSGFLDRYVGKAGK